MMKEFKDFIMRGNVIDLAVGVIIGAAFNTIVSSLVADVLMPPLGLLMGKVDFGNLYFVLAPFGGSFPTLEEAKTSGAVTINYGLFINTIVNFIIVAGAVFLMIRVVNRWQRQPPPPESMSKECPYCFTMINKKATRCPNCTSDLAA